MASEREHDAMRRARDLARRGTSTVAPNPVVGCVVLTNDGTVVGEGWHERPGGPHAEVAALRAAGSRASGATAVVTLEPCRHTGRTPPCTDALLAAGVVRVVYAVADPHADAGGGAQVLRAAGVSVEGGVDEAEGADLLGDWLVAARLGRPQVTWKYAATLDGRVAATDGSSRWITGATARHQVHELRAAMGAVMVGVGTVLADDPRLTVRDLAVEACQPLRVVVDSTGRTPSGARVRDDAAETWVATADEVGTGPDGRVDLAAVLRVLHSRGVQRVLLEGGPTLAAAMLRAGLVDAVIGYVSPLLLGAGTSLLAPVGIDTLSAALQLQIVGVSQAGDDVRIDAVVRSGLEVP